MTQHCFKVVLLAGILLVLYIVHVYVVQHSVSLGHYVLGDQENDKRDCLYDKCLCFFQVLRVAT